MDLGYLHEIKIESKHAENFWKKVAIGKEDECWEWTAHVNNLGYGRMRIGENMVLAHRISFIINGGTLRKNDVVRHMCHNESCVNPSHLSSGTHKENKMDSVSIGTHRFPVKRGEESSSSKLTRENVIEIRKMSEAGFKLREIAKCFNISVSHVWKIKNRERWNHI